MVARSKGPGGRIHSMLRGGGLLDLLRPLPAVRGVVEREAGLAGAGAGDGAASEGVAGAGHATGAQLVAGNFISRK